MARWWTSNFRKSKHGTIRAMFEAMRVQFRSPDIRLLFMTRAVRMFAYGFLSVVLVLYLTALEISEGRIGLLLTLTLVGDTIISLWLTTRADRLGRQKMLLAGAGVLAVGRVMFAMT